MPPATIAAVIVTHVLLLALLLRASLPYVYTQAMLAVELVVFNLATAVVHRERKGELLVSTVKLITPRGSTRRGVSCSGTRADECTRTT